jgi:acyl-CoA synthetase (NDP forming)
LLGATTAVRIAPILGDLAAPSNPVDLASSWDVPASLAQHDAILDALAADGGYDVVASRVTVMPAGPIDSALEHGRIVERATARHPAMLFTVLGRASDAINPEWQRFCAESGVLYLQGYRRGIGALANLSAYREFLAFERGLPVESSALPTPSTPAVNEPGLEVIVSAYRDALYGPVIRCALGGMFAGAFDERILRLAPVTVAEAQRAIDRSKIGQLALGFRDIPASDTAPLARLLATISAWFARAEGVVEMNPYQVTLRGAAIDIVLQESPCAPESENSVR